MTSEKTSITAYTVICSVAKLGALPRWRALAGDEAARLAAAFMRHAADSPLKKLLGALPTPLFVGFLDTMFIPGMAHHFLFRKRFIAERLERFLAEGGRQVIVLGAGLDTLALRSAAKHPHAAFFEVDLPATQAAKRRVLEKTGYALPSNFAFLAADLSRTPLAEALHADARFAPAQPTLVILEGVLMYLREADVKSLFTALHRLFTGPLTVIFGAMVASDEENNWRVRLINALLARNQEATAWHCPSARLPVFMAEMGYAVQESAGYKALQRQDRSPEELRNVPEEDENYYLVAKIPQPGQA